MEIVPGIHQLRVPLKDNALGYVNTYLIKGEGWLLVDTGWNDEESFTSFERQLKEMGLDFKDISLIVITHIHPDHFGLAGRIKQLSQADVLIHRMEQALIESRYLWPNLLLDEMGEFLRRNGVPESDLPNMQWASMGALKFVASAIPERALFGGETIPCGAFNLQVIWTPGHSRGHICLYEAAQGILFSGDHVLPNITPNVSLHVQSGFNPLGDYLCSLRSLRELSVRLVLPAHEQIFTDLQKRIDQLQVHHQAREAAILQTTVDEPKTAYVICSEIPWVEGKVRWADLPPLDRRVALTETLAHLEALRLVAKVELVLEDGLAFYQSARQPTE